MHTSICIIRHVCFRIVVSWVEVSCQRSGNVPCLLTKPSSSETDSSAFVFPFSAPAMVMLAQKFCEGSWLSLCHTEDASESNDVVGINSPYLWYHSIFVLIQQWAQKIIFYQSFTEWDFPALLFYPSSISFTLYDCFFIRLRTSTTSAPSDNYYHQPNTFNSHSFLNVWRVSVAAGRRQ
jgi:hypothetical protein